MSIARNALTLTAFAATASLSPSLALATPLDWPAETGGSGNWYERIDTPGLTFEQARDAAASMTFLGLQGRLLVLEMENYNAELNWVFENIYSPELSAGLQVYWVGATRPGSGGMGNVGWTSINGEAVNPSIVGSTWTADYMEGNTPYGACYYLNNVAGIGDYAQSNPTNLVRGFIVEYSAVPTPGTAGVVALGGLLLARRRRECNRKRI